MIYHSGGRVARTEVRAYRDHLLIENFSLNGSLDTAAEEHRRLLDHQRNKEIKKWTNKNAMKKLNCMVTDMIC